MSTIFEDAERLIRDIEARPAFQSPSESDPMVFTCSSLVPEAVQQCMSEADLLPFGTSFSIENARIVVRYADDSCYQALRDWSSNAYACCLIVRPHIER